MTISLTLKLLNNYKHNLAQCKCSFERNVYFSADTKVEKSNLRNSYKQGSKYNPAKSSTF
jgi:hypothetical protein